MFLSGRTVLAEGVGVRPFRSADLPVFSKLSPDRKREAIAEVETVLQILMDTRADGFSIKDSPRLIWRALRRFGLTPLGDIFDKMGDEDIVQIFSHRQTAIFSNLNLFNWITFTLEDLHTGAWFELTRRDEAVLPALHRSAVEVLSGLRAETFEPAVPEHLVSEVGTEGMMQFLFRLKYVSPLRENGQIHKFYRHYRLQGALNQPDANRTSGKLGSGSGSALPFHVPSIFGTSR